MDKTLLESFFDEKLSGYKEPQRRGTPKGDPIGFSRNKYKASLLLLTNEKQEVLAKQSGVSHAMLRKWNTEDEFKKTIDNHCDEFSERYINYVKEKIFEGEKLIKTPVNEQEIFKISFIGFKACRDSNHYSLNLAQQIVNKSKNGSTSIKDIIKKNENKVPFSSGVFKRVSYLLPIAVMAVYRYAWSESPVSRVGVGEQSLIRDIKMELKRMDFRIHDEKRRNEHDFELAFVLSLLGVDL